MRLEKTRADHAEAALALLQQQQELSSRETKHRVGNALQMASGLLLLQCRRAADPGVQQGLEHAVARIDVLAQVHRRLGHSLFGRIDFAAHLRDLCEGAMAPAGRARLVLTADSVELGADQAVPLALIAHELVGNAARHGSPSGEGRIAVTLRHADGLLTFTVADDGPGLPGDVTAAAGGGLGLDIVRALTRQMRGSLDLSNRSSHAGSGGGTCASVLAPPPDG